MNSDSSIVFHEDGGSSHRAEPVTDTFHKYDEIVS